MSPEQRSHTTIERALWCAAILIVAGSYYTLTATYERQIGALQAASQADYTGTVRNRQLAANASKARAVVAELEVRVATVIRDKPAPAVTATLVRDLDGLSAANGCRLISIVPSAIEVTNPATVKAPVQRHVAMQLPYTKFADVEFVVRGNYRGLLHVLAGVSTAHTLVDVQDISLTQFSGEQRRGRRGLLEAKIHAAVFRYGPAHWEFAS